MLLASYQKMSSYCHPAHKNGEGGTMPRRLIEHLPQCRHAHHLGYGRVPANECLTEIKRLWP